MTSSPRLRLVAAAVLLAIAATACTGSAGITVAQADSTVEPGIEAAATTPTAEPASTEAPTETPGELPATASPTATPTEPTPTTEPPAPTPTTAAPPQRELATLDDIDAAELAWLRSGIVDYRYTFIESCECDPEMSAPRTVTVRNQQVVDVTTDGQPNPFAGWTAEDLFDLARDSISRGEDVVLDPDENGFPTSGIFDVEAAAYDGGLIFKTADLEVLAEVPAGAELIAAVERWYEADIDSYSMTYRPICFCPPTEVFVTVIRRSVLGHVVTESEFDDPFVDVVTVDDLFRILRRAQVDGAVSIDVTYDPVEGWPTSFFIDLDEQIADEEFGFEVVALDSSDRPEPPPSPDVTAMCERFLAVTSIDDDPDTADEARAMLAQMLDAVDGLAAAAPQEWQAGAVQFERFLVVVGELAEANDWDPAWFDALEEDVFASTELDVVVLGDFIEGAGELCS